MYRNILKITALICFISGCSYIAGSVRSPEIDGRMVTFRVKIQSARTVQVAGDWNNWGAGDGSEGEVLVGLMNKSEDGSYWERTIELPPGRYKYLFVVNESIRILDAGNPRVVPDGKGGKASLLLLPGL